MEIRRRVADHVCGCAVGNLTLEMGTQDELLRAQVERLFLKWLGYLERMLCEAKAQGVLPASLDTTVTAQALLAYIEGVLLLAKARNDPGLIATLSAGTLTLMQYQDARAGG